MSTRKPPTPRKPARKRAPKGSTSVDELAALSPSAFRRAMLAQVLEDLAAARAKGSMSAVHALTSSAIRLRGEIAELEAKAETEALTYQSSDDLVARLVHAIAVLPDAVFERLEAAVVQRRTGRARMRVVQ